MKNTGEQNNSNNKLMSLANWWWKLRSLTVGMKGHEIQIASIVPLRSVKLFLSPPVSSLTESASRDVYWVRSRDLPKRPSPHGSVSESDYLWFAKQNSNMRLTPLFDCFFFCLLCGIKLIKILKVLVWRLSTGIDCILVVTAKALISLSSFHQTAWLKGIGWVHLLET